jgi:thioredoxin 1
MKSAEFFKSLKDGERTLLHFSASWCTPCKAMEPIMQEFLKEQPDVKYVKIDVDNAENADILAEFAVKSVPTIVSFYGKRKVNHRTSSLGKKQIEAMWELYE